MASLTERCRRYQKQRTWHGPWELHPRPQVPARAAVVIPVLGEQQQLPACLQCLAANPPQELAQTLIILVVNQPAGSQSLWHADNQQLLGRLQGGELQYPGLRLHWVDASSEGLGLPAAKAGAGLARKLGCDLVLPHLQQEDRDPALLLHLDADTWVAADYLPSLRRHFQHQACGGALLPYAHRFCGNAAQQQAGLMYELWLRAYVWGLWQAGSPYAYTALGSRMATTLETYIAVGGMSPRPAGEDFYFLQKVRNSRGLSGVAAQPVCPAARLSHRAVLGTGSSIKQQLTAQKELCFFGPQAFACLASGLRQLYQFPPAPELNRQLIASPYDFTAFLRQLNGEATWPQLCRQHTQPSTFHRAVSTWFNGLATWRFLRNYAQRHQAVYTETQLARWQRLWGQSPARDMAELLHLLRQQQSGFWQQLPDTPPAQMKHSYRPLQG